MPFMPHYFAGGEKQSAFPSHNGPQGVADLHSM